MEYSRHFKFLICAPAFDPADLEGQRLQAITEEIEQDGYGVMKARKVDDAELVIQTDAAVGCVLLDWGKRGPQGKMARLVSQIRKRGLDMPIIILVRHHRLEDIPVDVLREADGYVFLAEETPDFIAKNLISRLRQYAETLKTPFFGALVDYAEEGNQLWTCPGHNGGVFYARSPIGRIFFQHLGRGDLPRRSRQLGARPRRSADARGTRSGRAAGSGEDLRRRTDLFRVERDLVVQQDRAAVVTDGR